MRCSFHCLYLGALAFLAACTDSSSGSSSVVDLGIPAPYFALEDGVVAATFSENGVDQLRVVPLDGRRGVTISNVDLRPPLTGGGFVTFVVSEDGQDLNGDGDGTDFVPRVYDVRQHRTRGFPLAVYSDIAQDGALIAFGVPEEAQFTDLDGDGELDGEILHV